MNKILTAAIAALGALTVTAASAETATYKITKIDTTAHAITLGNGKVYNYDTAVSVDGYKVGDLVKVTFTEAGGKLTATAVAKP